MELMYGSMEFLSNYMGNDVGFIWGWKFIMVRCSPFLLGCSTIFIVVYIYSCFFTETN
jgi:hypothetical protein